MVVGVEGLGWLGCTGAELGGAARVVVVVAPWHGLGLQPVVGLGCPGLMPVFGGPAGWVGPGPCTCVGVGPPTATGWLSCLPPVVVGGGVVGPPVGGGDDVVVLSGGSSGGGGTSGGPPGTGLWSKKFPHDSRNPSVTSPRW